MRVSIIYVCTGPYKEFLKQRIGEEHFRLSQKQTQRFGNVDVADQEINNNLGVSIEGFEELKMNDMTDEWLCMAGSGSQVLFG